MEDLIVEFVTETNESLGLLDQEMVRFEQNPNDAAILGNIFRVMHTIKGTCGFLGLARLERVAHAGEDVLGKFRDGALPVTSDAVSLILKCLDQIRALLEALAATGNEPEGSDEILVAALAAAARGESAPLPGEAVRVEAAPAETASQPEAGAPVESEDGFPVAAELLALCAAAEQPVVSAPAIVEVPPPKVDAPKAEAPKTEAPRAESAPAEAKSDSNQSIRVNVDTLEDLMTLVSEMVLTRNQLLQLARRNDNSVFNEPIQRLSRVTSELQEGVMKTRMQPIGNAWSKLPRILRDLAKELGKKIDLEMHGENTELDRQVLELIRDPLTHMVRNSADHGLETPDVRAAGGKPETGTIKLSAFHEGGHIIIEIADDGRGLNTDKIRAKIVEKGLASAAEAAAMSDPQVQAFIMKPGFSTAEKVTNVSGRGVGMDVVRSNIEKIGGTLQFVSTQGRGSIFTIKIPLTLAIVSALIVKTANERFAMPRLAVQEVVRASARSDHRIETLNGAPVLRLRNRLLPLVDLAATLGLRAENSVEGFVVICKHGGAQFGLVVDAIDDSEEIVVKPLSRILRHTGLFSGNTIQGDGAVILILDVNGLAGRLATQIKAATEEDRAPAAVAKTVQDVLLFASGASLKAVALTDVHRIEHFDMTRVETLQGQPVIQYGAHLLPLFASDDSHGVKRQGFQTVLVFASRGHLAGLAVDSIIDIVKDELTITRRSVQLGIAGSGVVAGRAVDIIDAAHLVDEARESVAQTNIIKLHGEAA